MPRTWRVRWQMLVEPPNLHSRTGAQNSEANASGDSANCKDPAESNSEMPAQGEDTVENKTRSRTSTAALDTAANDKAAKIYRHDGNSADDCGESVDRHTHTDHDDAHRGTMLTMPGSVAYGRWVATLASPLVSSLSWWRCGKLARVWLVAAARTGREALAAHPATTTRAQSELYPRDSGSTRSLLGPGCTFHSRSWCRSW